MTNTPKLSRYQEVMFKAREDLVTVEPAITAKELRTVFRETILKHGGRRAGDQYAVPAGEPVNGRQPFFRFDVIATGYGRNNCTITLDRWNASNPPESARAWLEEHMHPYTRRASEKIRGTYWLTLPGNSDYTQATVRRADVAEVLGKWIPQERQWQVGRGEQR